MSAWRTDIEAFAGQFSEKGAQVKPGSLVAFGIPIDSRYGKADEIVRMLMFSNVAARMGVAAFIAGVFYDSKSCCCTIELKEEASRQPEVQSIVELCGDSTLSLFEVSYAESQCGESPP